MRSFCMTRKGKLIQKSKINIPGLSEETSTFGASEDGSNAAIKEEGKEDKYKPTFQDQLDMAVHHVLINQSVVLVNTMTDVMKSTLDGTLANDKDRGTIFFPKHKFPSYWTLRTDLNTRKQPMANDPSTSAQPATSIPMVLTKQPGGSPH